MDIKGLFGVLATAQSSLLKREAFLNWLMKEKPELVQELLKEYEEFLKPKSNDQKQLKQ